MSDTGPQKDTLQHFLETLRSSGGFDLAWTLSETQPGFLHAELSGPDMPLLLERNGELLHAIESLAASILHLEGEQAEQLSVDAGGFRAARVAAIQQQAREAIDRVRSSGEPFLFAPMNARERRLLHLALQPSGLPTASSGEGPRRFVVLYPEGATPQPERFAPPPAPRRDAFRSGGGFRRDADPRRDGNRGPRRGAPGRPGPGRPSPDRSGPDRSGPDRPRFDRDRPRSDNFGNRAEDPGTTDPTPAGSSVSQDLPGERRQRPALDPNGNPIEAPASTSTPDATVEARLRKLRENFRQR